MPYLVTLGSSDDDVATTPADWVAAHLGARRRSMLALATVPGLGHSYVNRTLSAAGLDDRKDCDTACPTARAHEGSLTKAVNEWLAATYPRQRGMAPQVGTLPLRPQNPLPASVGGRRVQWLAVTNSQHVRVAYDGVSRTRGVRTIGGGSMKACRYYEPMDPTQALDRCPDTELGVVNSLSRVLQVRLTPTGGVDLLTRPARGVREVVLTLNPSGSRPDRKPGTSLRVTVRTSSGARQVIDLSRLSEALRDRRNAAQDGAYTPTTVRIPITDARVRASDVVGVELTGRDCTGRIDLRRAELVTG